MSISDTVCQWLLVQAEQRPAVHATHGRQRHDIRTDVRSPGSGFQVEDKAPLILTVFEQLNCWLFPVTIANRRACGQRACSA